MSGLRRAVLATIKTRSYCVGGMDLPGEQVVALYHAIPDKEAMREAVGASAGTGLSDRRVDRSLQILKKSKLVRYVKGKGWRRVGEP